MAPLAVTARSLDIQPSVLPHINFPVTSFDPEFRIQGWVMAQALCWIGSPCAIEPKPLLWSRAPMNPVSSNTRSNPNVGARILVTANRSMDHAQLFQNGDSQFLRSRIG
jgi:hypothetical protein